MIVFADGAALLNGAMDDLRRVYAGARIVGCSIAGEIAAAQVFDGSLVATAIRFDRTDVRGCVVDLAEPADSAASGRELADALAGPGLSHVFVLSDGLAVNGSALVEGITSRLPEGVTVTGGLSGDGERFAETSVVWDGRPRSGAIVGVGFYGDALRVGYGSLGGWDPFGPERIITRSEGNVLYEMDGQSALALYKTYLGEYASELPASGLRFPLALRRETTGDPVVRTILAVDEEGQSLTFAGDVPEGHYARLMKANFDRLIDGATGAAVASQESLRNSRPELAILISCVGRKLVLQQRIEEEVEGVRDALNGNPALAGFYSYGELAPFAKSGKCELHNQTMTVTTLAES
ncbi:MAG: FIST N-terminal domain-containing protein [Dehalococcoidia bacterium]